MRTPADVGLELLFCYHRGKSMTEMDFGLSFDRAAVQQKSDATEDMGERGAMLKATRIYLEQTRNRHAGDRPGGSANA